MTCPHILKCVCDKQYGMVLLFIIYVDDNVKIVIIDGQILMLQVGEIAFDNSYDCPASNYSFQHEMVVFGVVTVVPAKFHIT